MAEAERTVTLTCVFHKYKRTENGIRYHRPVGRYMVIASSEGERYALQGNVVTDVNNNNTLVTDPTTLINVRLEIDHKIQVLRRRAASEEISMDDQRNARRQAGKIARFSSRFQPAMQL